MSTPYTRRMDQDESLPYEEPRSEEEKLICVVYGPDGDALRDFPYTVEWLEAEALRLRNEE